MIEPTVSIVIPVHRGGPQFANCLASVQRLVPAPLEVIVVVDGGCADACEQADRAGVRVVRLDSQLGPAAARNRGARDARGDVLFFLDSDVVVQGDAIARVKHVLADPALGAVIGSYDRHPPEPNFVSQYKNLAHRFTHQRASREAFTFWGACGAVRRGVFCDAGGFNEAYRVPSVEDIELGYRLRRLGVRIRLDPTLEVTHLKRWTLRTLVETDVCQRAVPWSELILREGRLHNDLNLTRASRLAVVLSWTLLVGLLLSAGTSLAAVVACGAALGLLGLDLPLLMFFGRERGLWFSLRSIPLRWLSHLYNGAGFAWACATHARSLRRARRRMEPA